MVKTASTMLTLGTKVPGFALWNVDGRTVSDTDFVGAPALLVMFLCNHCPFVKHLAADIAKFALEYQPTGLAIVAINPNDTAAYPQDAPAHMVREAQARGYVFPYLFDEHQEVAKAYRAACTPDFFLFDGHRQLVYRGQFDSSRPGSNKPITGEDLRAAVDAVLNGRPVPASQKPSIGCNIKWKPGNEPEYFNPVGVS